MRESSQGVRSSRIRLRAGALALALLTLLAGAGEVRAAAQEIRRDGGRVLKAPSYLDGLGLRPSVPVPLPAAAPSQAARAAWERLRELDPAFRLDWDEQRGTPRMLYGGATPATRGTPAVVARTFLGDYADLFNLTGNGQLRADETMPSRAGTLVSFRQMYRGVPVYTGTLTVLVDQEGRVRMASGGFHAVPTTAPDARLSADEAVRSAVRHLDPAAELARERAPSPPAPGMAADQWIDYDGADLLPAGLLRQVKARPVWYPTAAGFRVAWMVDVLRADNPRDFRVILDAETGEPLDAQMLTLSTHETVRVYTSNPDKVGRTDEPIPDIDKPVTGGPLSGAFTVLTNDQAIEIANPPYNHDTDPNNPTVDPNFDEQNVFYQNNRTRQRFRDLNGGPVIGSLNLDTNPLDSTVQLIDGGSPDPNNADNAFFTPSLDRTSFGRGSFHTGVQGGFRDLALEEGVVIHEYSHRIAANTAGLGGAVYGGAMNEGTADYWAATITNDPYLGEFANADPEEGHYSGWVGLYGFLRSMQNDRPYSLVCDNPFITNGCEVHSDGEIYGGVLWDLRDALIQARGFVEGTLIADRLVLQHLLNMSGGGMLDTDDFIEGRNALLSADSTLYGGAYECLIWQVFAGREIGSGATVGNPPGTPPTTSTALPAQCTGAATVAFSKAAFSCANPDSGTLTVSDPNGGAVLTVAVTTASGDSETLALSWAAGIGSTAAFNVRIAAGVPGDGQIQVAAQGERILASYADNSPVKTASAAVTIDCTPDLAYVSSRLFNGSCDGSDVFLDAGETARLGVTFENREPFATLHGVQLTLSSGNPQVSVEAPVTRTLPDLAPGARAEVFWSVRGDAALAGGASVTYTVQAGGAGITGAQNPVQFGATLERNLTYTLQTQTTTFAANNGGFESFTNGSTGTISWRYQTGICAGAPSPGYWHEGATGNCVKYTCADNSWLASPFIRITPLGGAHPSRLKALRFQHRVALGASAAGAAFISSDLFDRDDNLQQISNVYDSTVNSAVFVPVSINLETTPLPGFDMRHGWVQFRWLFIANNTGTCTTPTATQTGWYVDEVAFDYEVASEVADTTAPAACTPVATLAFAGATAADTPPSQGNGDGVLDAGETIALTTALANNGTGPANALVGHLTSNRPDIVTLVDNTATYPNVLALESTTSDAPHFTFTLSPAAICGTVITFTLTVDVNGAPGAAVFNFNLRVGSLVPAPGTIFSDDFEADTGVWAEDPDGLDLASSGRWQRANPTQNCYSDVCGTNNETQPGNDFVPGTGTGQCYITQDGGAPFNLHDVDNGTTTLQSSPFDLSGTVDPTVSFARWVYNRDGDPLDAFKFLISNNGGTSFVPVEFVSDKNDIPFGPVTNVWTPRTFMISDTLPVTNQMVFRFVAQDQEPGQIIEAALDAFVLRDSVPECNPFTPPALPPEVSPPGAGVPLAVAEAGPGQIQLSWETTSGATSYRIISGAVASLRPGGVTASNAAPLACGVATTTTTQAAPAASSFLLVAAENGAGVGPLGNASGGGARGAAAVCP